jgi:hypothetical protein
MPGPIREDYRQRRHCIAVKCGIPLATNYISRHVAALTDEHARETRRFRTLYGDRHWRAVIGWFEQAELELTRQ